MNCFGEANEDVPCDNLNRLIGVDYLVEGLKV